MIRKPVIVILMLAAVGTAIVFVLNVTVAWVGYYGKIMAVPLVTGDYSSHKVSSAYRHGTLVDHDEWAAGGTGDAPCC